MAEDDILNICFRGIGTPRRALEPGEDVGWGRRVAICR